MLIKVCGITNFDNLNSIISDCALNHVIPDYFGFITYKSSLRFVTSLDVRNLTKILPKNTKQVLVSVNEDLEYLHTYLNLESFNFIQLHGEEDSRYLSEVKNRWPGLKIIKAINISTPEDFNNLEGFMDLADYFLFDAKGVERGGNGIKFSWDLLEEYKLKIPYFLSGGISLEDMDDIKNLAIRDERLVAIDVNSRFEISEGIKDSQKIVKLLLSW